MITSNNFSETSLELSEEFESHDYSDINESLEKIYNLIETYKGGFSDREYDFTH